ncbi:hypothetical protein Tco_1472074 [Tanacetum coccineum]
MADSVKDMTTKFGKLDKFEGSDFRRWQKKMHFLLTTLKVAYVLMLEGLGSSWKLMEGVRSCRKSMKVMEALRSSRSLLEECIIVHSS